MTGRQPWKESGKTEEASLVHFIPDTACRVIYRMMCHQDFLLLTPHFYSLFLSTDPLNCGVVFQDRTAIVVEVRSVKRKMNGLD